jgi:hypothetical protein
MKAYYLPVALLGAALFSGCTTVTPAPVAVTPAVPSATYVVPPATGTVVVPSATIVR